MKVVQTNLQTGGLARAIAEALGSQQARNFAGQVANGEGTKLAAEAKGIAEEILHRRPENRRTKSSLAHGKEYHDSYTVTPMSPRSDEAAAVMVTNDHPAHAIIEKGSRGHKIPSSPGLVSFPWDPPSTKGTPTTKGVFTIEHKGELNDAFAQVEHPGTAPKRILRNAVTRYRQKSPHIVRTK